MSQTDTSAECNYLIIKQGYYYRPNSSGYTSSAICAGRYTKDEAESITHPNGPEGPRDGMHYIHESEIKDDDWRIHCQALATARNDALEKAQQLAFDRELSSPDDDFELGQSQCASLIAADIGELMAEQTQENE